MYFIPLRLSVSLSLCLTLTPSFSLSLTLSLSISHYALLVEAPLSRQCNPRIILWSLIAPCLKRTPAPPFDHAAYFLLSALQSSDSLCTPCNCASVIHIRQYHKPLISTPPHPYAYYFACLLLHPRIEIFSHLMGV